MPKYEIVWEEVHACYSVIEARNEKDALDQFWAGDVDVDASVSEPIQGTVDIREVREDD